MMEHAGYIADESQTRKAGKMPYGFSFTKLCLLLCMVLGLGISLTSCADYHKQHTGQPRKNSALTHGMVQMTIKIGETTQTDILETFGAPNVTSIDGSGQEVWTYQRAAKTSQSSYSGDYFTVIIFGGGRSKSGFEESSKMMTLIIKFDENKIVSDFRSRASNF